MKNVELAEENIGTETVKALENLEAALEGQFKYQHSDLAGLIKSIYALVELYWLAERQAEEYRTHLQESGEHE